jgi:hypothetical protein
MRQVFALRYKYPNKVEVFESYDDAVEAGVEFITEMGTWNAWSEDEINDEVSAFIDYKTCEAVEFYCCEVKEARQ